MEFRAMFFAGLLVVVLILLAACTSPTDLPGASPQESEFSSPTPAGRTESTTTPAPTTTATSSPNIPPGSVALFATISGGTKSQVLRQEGGNISWDSTHYKFLRYVPEAHILNEFGWTTSESYARSYIYGFTTGDWVYMVRRSTDTGSNDITRLDPRTGKTIGRFQSITVTGDWNFSFTILGNRLIYRTKIGEDLFGNRRSGGNVMALEMGGSPVKLLDYTDPNNKGSYYAIGEQLITIITSYEDKQGKVKRYDIHKVDPVTMSVGDLLFSFSSEDFTRFYEGTTALYWGQTDPATGDVKVIRFPISEQPSYYLTISENSPQLISIDESQGKVLIVSRDNTPESPFYNLVDLATSEISELEVDPAFYSTLVHGNGQFYILE